MYSSTYIGMHIPNMKSLRMQIPNTTHPRKYYKPYTEHYNPIYSEFGF